MPYVSFAVGMYSHWVHGPYAVVPKNTDVPRLVLSRRIMPTFNNPVALAVALASWAVILDTTQSDNEIPT